jgi:hypothetical protein
VKGHHVSVETLARTGRSPDPPRSLWHCSCGAGNPEITTPAAAHVEAERHLDAMTWSRRIGLVSCSGQKLDRRAPARELYTSPLFRKSLRHALGGCQTVYILSAKHGLLELDQELEPYDERLPSAKAERCAWGGRVAADLAARHWDRDLVLYMLAGQEYAMPLIHATATWWPDGWRKHILQPLQGKEVGRRLQWLNAHVLPPV